MLLKTLRVPIEMLDLVIDSLIAEPQHIETISWDEMAILLTMDFRVTHQGKSKDPATLFLS